MAPLRRHLRVFAVIWLMFQVASLSALVPRDCCSAHTTAAKACHAVAAVPQCPMHAASGHACPMHQGDHAAPAPADCRLTGGCSGPMAALVALLSNHGILPTAALASPADRFQPVAAAAPGNVIVRLAPPDSPPPRV